MDQRRTLCFVQREDQILLGYKKRGFGANKWNGFGGKLELHETLQEAAHRELWEESGLRAQASEQRGVLSFTFADGSPPLEVHVFVVTQYTGEPQETEEMRPQWWPIKALPLDAMWADDRYWIPLLFAGGFFTGRFHFQDTEVLLAHEVQTVAALPISRQE